MRRWTIIIFILLCLLGGTVYWNNQKTPVPEGSVPDRVGEVDVPDAVHSVLDRIEQAVTEKLQAVGQRYKP